jgi:beta-galactosidase
MQLGSTQQPNGPAKIEGIKVGQLFTKLHLLHATGWSTDEDTIIGEYVVTWDDDTSVTIPIRYGKDILDWWYDDLSPEPKEAKIAWKGANKQAAAQGKKIRLYLATWENPKPEKKVKTIDFTTAKETPCAPFCVAITAETK